jgi:hypothetical protein
MRVSDTMTGGTLTLSKTATGTVGNSGSEGFVRGNK